MRGDPEIPRQPPATSGESFLTCGHSDLDLPEVAGGYPQVASLFAGGRRRLPEQRIRVQPTIGDLQRPRSKEVPPEVAGGYRSGLEKISSEALPGAPSLTCTPPTERDRRGSGGCLSVLPATPFRIGIPRAARRA